MKATIDKAREANLYVSQDEWVYLGKLKRFAELVRADERSVEREACAKVCDELSPPCGYNLTETSFWDVTSLECAAAIRARGNT